MWDHGGVFPRGALERLETDRFAYYAVHATVIQSFVRGRAGRLTYERVRRDLVRCQSVGRRWRAVRRWGEVRGKVVVVQSWVRGRGAERCSTSMATIVIRDLNIMATVYHYYIV